MAVLGFLREVEARLETMTLCRYDRNRHGEKRRTDIGDGRTSDGNAYAFADSFTFADFANGEAALPALIAAHRLRAASAMAFRPAALSLRLRRLGCATGVVATFGVE